MFCNNCGEKISEGAAFCQSCGKAVDNEIIDGNTNSNSVPNNQYGVSPSNYGQVSLYQQPYPQQPYVQQPYGQQTYVTPQPTIVNIQPQPIQTRTLNGFCVAGFALSIAGMFIGAIICGLAATTFSIIGIVTYDENKQNGKWMGLTGVVLGIIDLIIGLFIASLVSVIIDSIGMI
ncbi:MAG: zinc-ribbon domain-containing protein [Lachnospirales bacterium]